MSWYAADSLGAPQPKQAAPKQVSSVPADDSQPECALSGEAFETFWDDAAEEWRFRDAMRLSARQAARCARARLPLCVWGVASIVGVSSTTCSCERICYAPSDG